MGKFIAAAAFMLVTIGLAGTFPLILVAFGNPEVGVTFAGYLGLSFLAISFVSIGLFTSSLTENQIIVAIGCFGLLLLLFVLRGRRKRADRRMPTCCDISRCRIISCTRLRYHRHPRRRLFPECHLRGAVLDRTLGRVGALAVR